MKKAFLIASLAMLFVCLLAIGVGARTFESNYDIVVEKFYDGNDTEIKPDWANVTDENATAVIKRADNSFIRVPAYDVFKANGNNQFMAAGSNFDFGWLEGQLGEELTLENLVAFEVPNGTKSFSGAISDGIFTALEEFVIPTSVTSLPQSMFRNNNVLIKVFVKQTMGQDGNVQGVTTVPGWFADITDNSVSRLEAFDFELDYVTSLGQNAFMNSALKSFKVNAPMTSLGSTAFCGCKSLETVELNNTGNPIGVGSKLFAGCISIRQVTLNNFSSLPDYLFEDANGAAGTLIFEATGIATTGTMPFKNATNLKSATIIGPLTSIGSNMFLGCSNLETVEIINTLDTPATGGDNLCDGRTTLKSVTMEGVNIGKYAFRNINGSEMKLSFTNVASIGEQAFYKAGNITELYIEGELESVGNSTYRECPKLTKLTIINTGDTYVSSGNGESNPELLELKLVGKFDIGKPAFQNNTKLKTLYLGEGVRNVEYQAFFQCYALETAYLADTITSIADRAFDMNGSGKQTSASFMFVDENGNMDNTLPTSLTFTGGHFLKGYTVANTYIIYPQGYTSAANSAYDFEHAILPQGFSIIYLGKMTSVDYSWMYKHNNSRDITVYLTNNSTSDIGGERINVNVAEDGTMSHGSYAGATTGTLEFVIDDNLHNYIKPVDYIKFIFCGSGEVCFLTRVNIPREEGGATSWGNFVSMPVTYEQLEAAYDVYNATAETDKTVPVKHPIVSAPVFSPANCTQAGGLKTFCLGCGQIVSIEKTEDALGHNLGEAYYIFTTLTEKGKTCKDCVRCGEFTEETEHENAILTDIGYSVMTFETGNGTASFDNGYTIDNELLAIYEATKGTTVTFGVAFNAYDGFDFDGTLDSFKVKSDIVASSDADFGAFAYKVIYSDASRFDALIVIGVYARENEALTFVNADNGVFAPVSYNSVLNSAQ